MSNHSGQRTHGGARAGAGRKPAHGVATTKKSIQLTPREWAQLEQVHPIASQAVRQLLSVVEISKTFPAPQTKKNGENRT